MAVEALKSMVNPEVEPKEKLFTRIAKVSPARTGNDGEYVPVELPVGVIPVIPPTDVE